MKLNPYLFIILLFSAHYAKAQSDTTFIPKAISKLNTQAAQEKVYLHLDKQGYSFGDTIWYKAYTVIGQHHQLSALSGVLYVEFYGPKDLLITRQTVQLHSGIGWGSIVLPRNAGQGSYRIRAYTNWMRNFGDNSFYDQRVRIGGIAPNTATAKNNSPNPDVQFFPEGGELVEGVRSRVAFKAVGVSGLGEDIKGNIIDNTGNIVTDFTTQHLGMGVFALTPEAGKTYKARITGAGETSFTADLPIAKVGAYTLAINNSQADSIFIKVSADNKLLNDKRNSAFYIVAQSNGKIYYTTEGTLQAPSYMARVEKSRFPAGITQFTLFSDSGEPVAERLAYIAGIDTLQLSIKADQNNYNSYKPIKLIINGKSDNKPVQGSFSVAVINDSKVNTDEDDQATIINNLLFTSELKGHIEQPNYYFTNTSDQTRADLDVLMLTQGYRRFEWQQVLSDKHPAMAFQPEQSLEVNGILKTHSGKPLPAGKVTLVETQQGILRDTVTDQNGRFSFPGLYITDSATLVLRARRENKSADVEFGVAQPGYPALTKTSPTDTAIAINNTVNIPMQQRYEDYKKQQKTDFLRNGIQLKQVTITAKKIAPDMSRSTNLHGGGNADQVIMGDDLGSCIDLADCLVGKVFGVTFSGGAPYNLRPKYNKYGRYPPMSVIIDGVIMTHDHLDDINENDVYSIEVLRSDAARSIYGSSIEGGGALIITLRHGGEKRADNFPAKPNGVITFPFAGYTKTRAFYQPKYALSPNQPIADRTTVYWNPNIITDKDGNYVLEFFNAASGHYRVEVQGIDDNGNLGRQVFKYNVN